MRSKTSLAAALIAFGGAGVAFAEGHGRSEVVSGSPDQAMTGGVSIVKADDGGYEIQLS